jgi:hypothetical protein
MSGLPPAPENLIASASGSSGDEETEMEVEKEDDDDEEEEGLGLDNDNPDPPSDNEDEPDDDAMAVAAKICSMVELPREDDVGFSAYDNVEDPPPEDSKKRKKTPAQKKAPDELPPERRYARFKTGDEGLKPPNEFKKKAAGTSGSNLSAFRGSEAKQSVSKRYYCFHY